MNLETTHVGCPYCGETVEIVVDPSVEQQEYVEDCFVCCRPIVLSVTMTPSGVSAVARSENE